MSRGPKGERREAVARPERIALRDITNLSPPFKRAAFIQVWSRRVQEFRT